MVYEDIRNEIKLPSNKSFGVFFASIFGILSTYFNYRGWSVVAIFFMTMAIIFLVLALLFDTKLHFLNIMWSKIGILIGKVTNPIVLGVVFFGIFMPMSLFFRTIGRDELFLRKRIKSSYWKTRKAPAQNSNTFKEMH
jgi:hypothetical protein